MSFTQQQLFDMAYLGVMNQGGPTRVQDGDRNKIVCLYTDTAGRHCGVGHCMPPEMHASIKDWAVNGELIETVLNNNPDIQDYFGAWNRDFLCLLQGTHDNIAQSLPEISEGEDEDYNLTEPTDPAWVDKEFIARFDLGMHKFAQDHMLTVPHFEKATV